MSDELKGALRRIAELAESDVAGHDPYERCAALGTIAREALVQAPARWENEVNAALTPLCCADEDVWVLDPEPARSGGRLYLGGRWRCKKHCSVCRGSGRSKAEDYRACGACNGTGLHTVSDY